MSFVDPSRDSSPSNFISAQQLIEPMLEGALITDNEGQIQFVNPSLCKSLGYQTRELIGANTRQFKSTKHKPAFYKKMWNAIQTTGLWQGEICNLKKNGQELTLWLTITAIKNSKGKTTHYLGLYSDISQKMRAAETIKYMAYYDPLTGLPNRSLFRDRLKQALAQVKRQKKLLAVLFLDLDRVKIINDTLGHGMGDQLLKNVARRLESCLREGDTVARLGGDEFMVLLPGVEHLNDVAKISEKIIETLKPPFSINNNDLTITASIGISLYPYDGKDPDSLYKNADTAMFHAKQHGRNTYQVFTPAMKEEVFEQVELGNNLRRALENEEFVLFYQPQLNIKTGEIIGMEALIRWQHPEFGLLPPKKFIRLAEESGMIVPIGDWVLKRACEQTKKWHDKKLSRLRVSVNLSPTQFKSENFVRTVEKTLEETNLAPDCLDLEITESVVMENAGSSLTVPHDLRAMGIRFSIDDFGTGYSSLSYLKHFPVNTLKMDQSFIRDLTFNPSDSAIATAVIALGHGLHLSVLAEGVETEHQLDILKRLDCDFMQGFLFSEPVPAGEFEKLLLSNRKLSQNSLFETPYV